MTTETRYIILGSDGRHVTISRQEPNVADLIDARAQMQKIGMSGFIARMDGCYRRAGPLALTMVHQIGEADWDIAVACFRLARSARSGG